MLTRNIKLGGAALAASAALLAACQTAENTFTCQSVNAQSDSCIPLSGKIEVSSFLWPDVCDPGRFGWRPTQGSVNQYGWRAFTALNWPAKAGERGEPDPAAKLGAKGPDGRYLDTVWETWKGITEVFDYADPSWKLTRSDWNKPVEVPAICPQASGARLVQATAKARPWTLGHAGDSVLQSVNQAGTGPLVDRNGKLVHYEILINKVMFDDIVDHHAWDKSNDELNCEGKYHTKTCKKFEWSLGAMEVKAAWKQLSPTEKASGRFFDRDLLVYVPADPAHGVKESCTPVSMGLVGFHIASKTKFSVQPGDATWFWPTFEHANNVPPLIGPVPGVDYSFYDRACSPKVTAEQCWTAAGEGKNSTANPASRYACCPNLFRWEAAGPKGASINAPRTANQVTRMTAPPEKTLQCNILYRAAVHGTIWGRYFMATAQWPKASDTGGDTEITPAVARNSALESFMARWNKDASSGKITVENTSSCMGCHQFGVDMSFVFDAGRTETGND